MEPENINEDQLLDKFQVLEDKILELEINLDLANRILKIMLLKFCPVRHLKISGDDIVDLADQFHTKVTTGKGDLEISLIPAIQDKNNTEH